MKTLRDFKLISFWDGVNSKKGINKLFSDETEEGIGLNKNCEWIQKGDLLLILKNEIVDNEIDWADNQFISNSLYKVNELGADERDNRSNAVIKFEPHKLMKTSNGRKFFKASETIRAIKIRLNILGEIEAKGEECF